MTSDNTKGPRLSERAMADTIDALVAALERLTRVARVELATTRPDVIEQADAALALARKGATPS